MDRPYAIMIRRTLFTVLLASLAAAGCRGDDEQSDTNASYSVRDSAGVQIVSVDGLDRPGAVWRLAPSPEVVVGVLQGSPLEQLFEVRDAAMLPDGRMVVANSGTFELRFFGSQGDHLDSLGGRGMDLESSGVSCSSMPSEATRCMSGTSAQCGHPCWTCPGDSNDPSN